MTEGETLPVMFWIHPSVPNSTAPTKAWVMNKTKRRNAPTAHFIVTPMPKSKAPAIISVPRCGNCKDICKKIATKEHIISINHD